MNGSDRDPTPDGPTSAEPPSVEEEARPRHSLVYRLLWVALAVYAVSRIAILVSTASATVPSLLAMAPYTLIFGIALLRGWKPATAAALAAVVLHIAMFVLAEDRGGHPIGIRVIFQLMLIMTGGIVGHVSNLNRSLKTLIARQQQTERELASARDQALDASKTKSQFLANMSHELRTPLNAIIGYSEMLGEELGDEGHDAWCEDIQKIRASGQHLLALINDILDLSKVEAGRMELDLQRFALADVLGFIEDELQPLFQKRGNHLAIQNPFPALELNTDRRKLQQVLLNLLSNANKFTHEGTVEVEVEWLEGERMCCHVRDTGIGIDEATLERLFQPFVQADASTTRKHGGTGLGLVLSRRFSRLMGGDLTVASTPGEGSTFTLTLPLDATEATPPA